MHAGIPMAFRDNMATYAQFRGMLGRLLSPDRVHATGTFVAECTRVAWFSILSLNGPNAHLLPEVLPNTDTHLDLFDSEYEDASDFEELIEVQANSSPQWFEFSLCGY